MRKKKTKRVCHLSSVHQPDDVRIYKECRALARRGYEVSFVVPEKKPGQKSGQREGVEILEIERPASRLRRMVISPWRVLREALRSDSELYHFHDAELIPIGVVLKALGYKVIYDVHEDLPQDILNKKYLPKGVRRMVAWLAWGVEGVATPLFDGIVAATPSIARRFPRQSVVVQNFPEWLAPRQASGSYQKRELSLAYIGTISEIRGLNEMLAALDLLADRGISLKLAGRFESAAHEGRARSHPGWRSVEYLGWQQADAALKMLSTVRAGMVLFHPAPNHIESQPNKLFEYMSAGIPVIASNFPLWKEIVEKNGCGVLVDPQDPEAIARAIAWVVDHPKEAEMMGRRGRQAVERLFNWTEEERKLVQFYHSVLGPSKIPPAARAT